jgi:hypothetical protein
MYCFQIVKAFKEGGGGNRVVDDALKVGDQALSLNVNIKQGNILQTKASRVTSQVLAAS